MTSYWKLVYRDTEEVISIGDEKSLLDLKMLYENKMNTRTKMIKCFGKSNYNKDFNELKSKSLELLEEHKCYM